jgi:hypothetical protein
VGKEEKFPQNYAYFTRIIEKPADWYKYSQDNAVFPVQGSFFPGFS